MTDKYIGCKIVTAFEQEKDNKSGYGVIYPDGYQSWSPKEVFESAYLKIEGQDKIAPSISHEMVDNFIKEKLVCTLGEKTTCLRVILVNGFEIVETSSCVDPKNYDEELGANICYKKIQDKIWFLLGFLLQSGLSGFKK